MSALPPRADIYLRVLMGTRSVFRHRPYPNICPTPQSHPTALTQAAPIVSPLRAGDGGPRPQTHCDRTRLAAPNKYLALNNKSCTRGGATNKAKPPMNGCWQGLRL